MTATVVPFAPRPTPAKRWTVGEISECYRVVVLFGRAGLPVSLETGLTDEDDPWLVFVRDDTQDVLVHLARIDGLVVAASVANDAVVRGRSLRDVLDQVLRTQPLVLPPRADMAADGKLFLHPAAALAAFVATALVFSTQAEGGGFGEGAATREGSAGWAAGDAAPAQQCNVLKAALTAATEPQQARSGDGPVLQHQLAAAVAAISLLTLGLSNPMPEPAAVELALDTPDETRDEAPAPERSLKALASLMESGEDLGVSLAAPQRSALPIPVASDATAAEALPPWSPSPVMETPPDLLAAVLPGILAPLPPMSGRAAERLDSDAEPATEPAILRAAFWPGDIASSALLWEEPAEAGSSSGDASAGALQGHRHANGGTAGLAATTSELDLVRFSGVEFYRDAAALFGFFDGAAGPRAGEPLAAAVAGTRTSEASAAAPGPSDPSAAQAAGRPDRPLISGIADPGTGDTSPSAVPGRSTEIKSGLDAAKAILSFVQNAENVISVNAQQKAIAEALLQRSGLPVHDIDRVLVFSGTHLDHVAKMLMPGVALVNAAQVLSDTAARADYAPVTIDLHEGATVKLIGLLDV